MKMGVIHREGGGGRGLHILSWERSLTFNIVLFSYDPAFSCKLSYTVTKRSTVAQWIMLTTDRPDHANKISVARQEK